MISVYLGPLRVVCDHNLSLVFVWEFRSWDHFYRWQWEIHSASVLDIMIHNGEDLSRKKKNFTSSSEGNSKACWQHESLYIWIPSVEFCLPLTVEQCRATPTWSLRNAAYWLVTICNRTFLGNCHGCYLRWYHKRYSWGPLGNPKQAWPLLKSFWFSRCWETSHSVSINSHFWKVRLNNVSWAFHGYSPDPTPSEYVLKGNIRQRTSAGPSSLPIRGREGERKMGQEWRRGREIGYGRGIRNMM